MKTIVQINICGNGSTGRIMQMLEKKATEQGYRVICAFGRNDIVSNGEYINIGSKFHVYKHVALTRVFDKHGYGSKKPTQKLVEQLKKIKPDLIHLHNIHGYYINIEILFKYIKEQKIPVIWTLHDCWALTGKCAHFDFVGCNKWRTGCYDCVQKMEYPSSILFDHSKESYNMKKDLFTSIENIQIICPSEWLANVVKQSYLNEYPVYVINNGIDLTTFKPISNTMRQKLRISNDKFVILGVATRFEDKRKGLHYFLKLSEVLNDDNIIVLVGVSEKLQRKLPRNIIGLPRTENINELVELYSMADVFINASVEETFGLVTAEAMACGTPVIVFNSTACPEIVNDQVGMIVEKGDINELAQAVNHFNLIGKEKYREACLQHMKKYDVDLQNQKYISKYISILS